MNLLIATTKKDFSFNRLEEEAIRENFSVNKIFYEDMENLTDPNFFKKMDFCILRDPYNTGIDFSKHFFYIKNFFNENSLLDFNTLNKFPQYEDKLFQNEFFSKHGIKMARFNHISDLKKIDEISFPCIIKKRISSRGKEVFLTKSKSSAKEFFKNKNIQDYLFEEYIPLEKDYRIMIIQDKIIDCVSRNINIHSGELKRIGVRVNSKSDIPEEIKKIASELATKARAMLEEQTESITKAQEAERAKRALETDIPTNDLTPEIIPSTDPLPESQTETPAATDNSAVLEAQLKLLQEQLESMQKLLNP